MKQKGLLSKEIDLKLEALRTFLRDKYLFHRCNHRLKYDTYFKMGGIAKFFIEPQTSEGFSDLISYLKKNELKYKIIGATSNVFLLDDVVYSIIISTRNLTQLIISNEIVSVDAGYSLEHFVRVMVTNNCSGFEGLEGIPGSIGGAVFMNAGAYGFSVSDNLISIECLDENGKCISLNKHECNFEYRNSIFKSGKYVILKAKFKMTKGEREQISQRIERYHIARHSYQEFVYPNLGSMISISGNIYQEIMKDDPLYLMCFRVLKFLYKNQVTKFVKRKRPESIVFNKLLFRFIKKKHGKNLRYCPSVKSANVLLNDGTHTTSDLLYYMQLMHQLLGENYHVENELVVDPIYEVSNGFQEEFNKILGALT